MASSLFADATAAYVGRTWRASRRRSEPHRLPGRLTVSLTSYPRRYPTLAATLKSVLAQTVRPDRIVLWIAEEDFSPLPGDVLNLVDDGLTIATCRDLRSYNKIVPTLQECSDQFIVTVDDDQFYPNTLLRDLVNAYRSDRREVICARAHRIKLDADERPQPYGTWEHDVTDGNDPRLLFPTGVGGVLYPPGIFHPDVMDVESLLDMCPTADDVWLYWMAARAGARVRKVGGRRRQVTWSGTQDNALYTTVNRTANDIQIDRMIARYGFPGTSRVHAANLPV